MAEESSGRRRRRSSQAAAPPLEQSMSRSPRKHRGGTQDVEAASSSSPDSGPEAGAATGSEHDSEDADLPFPGFVDTAFYCLRQTDRPRNWALAVITWPWTLCMRRRKAATEAESSNKKDLIMRRHDKDITEAGSWTRGLHKGHAESRPDSAPRTQVCVLWGQRDQCCHLLPRGGHSHLDSQRESFQSVKPKHPDRHQLWSQLRCQTILKNDESEYLEIYSEDPYYQPEELVSHPTNCTAYIRCHENRI